MEDETAKPAPSKPNDGVRTRVHHRPSKGDPVIHAGDAGGPNDGRNLTTVDLDHDAGKPEPNVLERNAHSADKPRGKDKRS